MASSTICKSCLRAISRQQIQHLSRSRGQASLLPFTRYSSDHAVTKKTQPNITPHEPKPAPPSPDALKKLAASLRSNKALKNTVEPYVAYGGTEDLYRLCAAAPAYIMPTPNQTSSLEEFPTKPQNAAGEDVGIPTDRNTFWYRPAAKGGLELDVTFNTWAQIVYLHMYLLTVRLRMFPAEHAKIWHQQLLDHFFYAAEDRMERMHGITTRSTRNKYLKDLWQQWRGVIFSYDEGLVKGDAVLAGAIWRNLFKGDVNADIEGLAKVVVWMRRELKMLEVMSDQAVSEASLSFGEPGQVEVGRILEKSSGWLSKPFKEEEKQIPGEQTAAVPS